LRKGIVSAGLIAALWVWSLHTLGQVKDPEFIGSIRCRTCHRIFQKELIENFLKSPHAKAMADIRKTKEAIVSDLTTAPFPKEKIAYAFGSGIKEQAYLGQDLKLLPGRWLAAEKRWVPEKEADARKECLGCHTLGYDPSSGKWLEIGVGCESCHGPGSEHEKAVSSNLPVDAIRKAILSPKKIEPKRAGMICGQCHSSGKDKSGSYPFPVGFRAGDNLEDFFLDSKPKGPGRNQQFSDLIQSKHWEKDVICYKCHDPHGFTKQPHLLRKPVNDLCMECHGSTVKDIKSHAPNAPEGATCATCHMPNGRHTFEKPGEEGGK
jgi:predicted CXXCH cytochrome family protein